MPIDLLIAITTITLLSAALGWVGLRSRGWSVLRYSALAVAATIMLLLHALWLADNPLLARVLPLADVVAWANVQTPAMGLLAGIAWAHLPGPRRQKVVLVGCLVAIGMWRLLGPYLGGAPALGPARWTNGVCRQSTKSTCAAASAATLLATRGISATEAEMTSLCLTHPNGTTNLGLYRGLKLKTRGSGFNVHVFGGSALQLRHEPLPAVVSIGVSGLPVGVLGIGNRHSVVIFGFIDDHHVDIGDPYAGRQVWTFEQFAGDYKGVGFSLISGNQ